MEAGGLAKWIEMALLGGGFEQIGTQRHHTPMRVVTEDCVLDVNAVVGGRRGLWVFEGGGRKGSCCRIWEE